MRKRYVALLSAALIVGGILASASPAAAADNACWRSTKGEKAFASKINRTRSSQGLGSLSLDPELSKAAKVHTREMIRQSFLYHTPATSLRSRVTNWLVLGENVGVGGGVTSLHGTFMDSPTHRTNILGASYRHVGIGVVNRHGRMWVTILFEGLTDPGTPLRMPSC